MRELFEFSAHRTGDFNAIYNLLIEGGYYIETDIDKTNCFIKKDNQLRQISVSKCETETIKQATVEKAKEIFPRLPHTTTPYKR